jgi:hypothetical protein
MSVGTLSSPRRVYLLGFLALLLLPAACSGGSAKPPTSSAVTRTVGTPGGQVTGLSGAAVAVPPGALDGDTTVGLEPTSAAPPAGVGAVSALYQFVPDGVVFASPVTVTLPLPAGTSTASVYWQRPDKTGFDALGGRVDLAAHTITVDVPHFSQGVVGAARGNRLVSGTAMTTYISATSRVSVPTPSFTPPQALVPDGAGGYTVIPGTAGTGKAAGTFLIPDVPVGEYLLRLGGTYFLTDSSAPNLSVRVGGRPPDQLTPITMVTTLDLTLHNLAPWQVGDQLEFFSTEAGMWDFYSDRSWATSPLLAGDTTASLSMDLGSLNCGPPTQLIQGSRGHRAYLAQIASATSPGGVPYQAMARLVRLPSFDVTDGGTAAADAAMVDYTQANTAAFDLRFSAFKAAFDQDGGPASAPYYSNDAGNLGVLAQPGQAEDGFYSCNADLLLIEDTTGSDALTGPMHFGSPVDSPFAGSWGVLGDVRWIERTRLQLPGTTVPVHAPASIEWITSLAALQAGPLTPPLTQPRLATVAGLPYFDGGAGVGLTPTLTWSPPATGTADFYIVTIGEAFMTPSNGTGVAPLANFSSYTTPHPTMTVPPDVLVTGHSYYFRITAKGRAPGVEGLNDAKASVVSGIFTP